MEAISTKSQTELDVFVQALQVARERGGESRRNAEKLSALFGPFDRPDILIYAGNNRVIGIEHFRVDQLIERGKKKKSEAAKFSSEVEHARSKWVEAARTGHLPIEALQDLGDLISKSNQIILNSCVDNVAVSLEAGLFGGHGRGHCWKLDQYEEHIFRQRDADVVELGLLVEFHTNMMNWFHNDGTAFHRIALGEFPLSAETYGLLEKAAAKVDWLVLAFCPLYDRRVIDALVVDCRNGKLRLSMKRQKQPGLYYLGLGKDLPFGAQAKRGDVEFEVEGGMIHYSVENTSDQIDEMELLVSSVSGATKAINLSLEGRPFAASLPVQLVYSLVKGSLRCSSGAVDDAQVGAMLLNMPESTKVKLSQSFYERWGINHE